MVLNEERLVNVYCVEYSGLIDKKLVKKTNGRVKLSPQNGFQETVMSLIITELMQPNPPLQVFVLYSTPLLRFRVFRQRG